MVAIEVTAHSQSTRAMRQSRDERSKLADMEARAISKAAFVGVGGTDPLLDMTYDMVALLRDHHDYPSADMLGHYTTEA